MRGERWSWAVLLIAVLLAGWLMGRLWRPGEAYAPSETTTFRAWFWERRTLDLLAQAGLIFAGALGVAALLPGRQGMREISAGKHKIDAASEEPDAPLD